MEQNLTNSFVDFLWEFSKKDISVKTKAEIEHTFLDYLGAYLAGIEIGYDNTSRLITLLGDEGKYNPLFSNASLSVENAALVNGVFAHCAELDDGQRKGLVHPGTVVFSSLMALYEKHHFDENDFYKAALGGYEATIRLAQCVQPAAKIKGYHATGVFGSIGAALACSIALGANKEELKRTLSAACTSASGILRVIKNISQLKPFNSGNAAKNAITAAYMGKAGFDGPIELMEGELGFLSMFSESFDKAVLLGEDDKPKIFTIYRKPYAACRHCHPAIDLAIDFKEIDQISAGEIKTVEIKTYNLGIAGHEHVDIVGVNSAKMSTPFSFAVALFEGKAGLHEFEQEFIDRAEISELTKKVSVKSNDYFNEHYPNKRGAAITIVTDSGQQFTRSTDLPKGEPETAMTHNEIKDKFTELAIFAGLDMNQAQRIIDVCTDNNLNLTLLLDQIKNINLIKVEYETK